MFLLSIWLGAVYGIALSSIDGIKPEFITFATNFSFVSGILLVPFMVKELVSWWKENDRLRAQLGVANDQ